MNAGALCVPEETGGEVLEPAEFFGRHAPLVLDLGCGNGVFLSALAAREPAWNVLGVEKKDYRVRQARRRCGALGNTRVVHGGIGEMLRRLPTASVSRAYLLFSDPWPKRRHADRRLARRDFADLLRRCMASGGEFGFASDSSDYVDEARGIFESAGGWLAGPWEVPQDWPRTEFERRFLAAGVRVFRFRARRTGAT